MGGLYRGFSTYEFQRSKTFRLSDVELVKMDILNHIFTRKGERVHMPTYGTRIPDIVFEPLDDITVDIIRDDILAVIRSDPRVRLIDVVTNPEYDTSSIAVDITLEYVELRMTDVINLNLQLGQEY